MPVPDFQSCMLPLLKAISDGSEHEYRSVKRQLIDQFKLTDEELRLTIPSGRAFLFDNRVGWANTYLKKAGLISSRMKGYLQITATGKNLLSQNPARIKIADLRKYDAFKEFQSGKERPQEDAPGIEVTEKSPEEIIDNAFESIQHELATELLRTIKSCSPLFFEKMVIDLLLRMGYGGSRKEAGMAIGKSGDGGVDGIINEDKLGLDSIYVQAKRWENAVPVKELRDFAGSLLGRKARKGIFITTSEFPKNVYEFVSSIDHKIVLIDGEKLASLMIEYNVGVTTSTTYALKSVDSDYFEEQ